MSAMYMPAGYSDEEDDYDDYNGYYGEEMNNDDGDTVERVEPWSRPPKLNLVSDQSNHVHVRDTLSFLDLIRANDVAGVRECLEHDKTLTNVNLSSTLTLSEGGSRPIFIACHRALPDMISLFVEFGADLGPDSTDSLTPLMSVCSAAAAFDTETSATEFESRLVRCAEILIDGGKADVNARQTQKMTALMFAAKEGHDLLVDFLIRKGASVDDLESQRWTALTFAVDADQGHVVRRLLEAGADPDIASLDGRLPIDLADSKNNAEMVAVIKSFARRDKLVRQDNVQITKFTELDNILLGLNAAEYIPLFNRHGVELDTFLQLNEHDLEAIGVDKVGVRKKLFQAIVEIHQKDWSKSSLHKLTPKDQQNGIYLTCPDAVAQVANICQHFKFLSANFQFLKRHLAEKPEMLLIGKDVADASSLARNVYLARQNLNLASKQLNDVDAALKASTKKLGIEVAPVDRVAKRSGRGRKRVFLLTAVAISSTLGFCYAAAKVFAKN